MQDLTAEEMREIMWWVFMGQEELDLEIEVLRAEAIEIARGGLNERYFEIMDELIILDPPGLKWDIDAMEEIWEISARMTEFETKIMLIFHVRTADRILFILSAFKLFFCDMRYNIINFFAKLFLSRTKKRTQILTFTNNLLTKKICERQNLYEKCEHFKKQLTLTQ